LRVLFVCTANICRSPSAEAIARAAGLPGVELGSAGTHARDGEPINPDMAAVLPPGLDTSRFRSRRLTPALVEEADLVVTMEAAHRDFVLSEQPEAFRKVFTLGQLARAVEGAPAGLDRDALLAHLGTTRPNADPALDVPDPYRRGAEACAGCVQRLQELLRTVLPALAREGSQGGADHG
jgi:protein-tyrosine-phosphatase